MPSPTIALDLITGWRELRNKAARELGRMRALEHAQDSPDFSDALYNFSVTAWHTIEWAEKSGEPWSHKDALRSSTRICECRDYATAGKHFDFDRPQASELIGSEASVNSMVNVSMVYQRAGVPEPAPLPNFVVYKKFQTLRERGRWLDWAAEVLNEIDGALP